MRPEIAVLDIQGQYRVYTEFYRADAAEKTIILVNGSMATTASFAQTVKTSIHSSTWCSTINPTRAGQKPTISMRKCSPRKWRGRSSWS